MNKLTISSCAPGLLKNKIKNGVMLNQNKQLKIPHIQKTSETENNHSKNVQQPEPEVEERLLHANLTFI